MKKFIPLIITAVVAFTVGIAAAGSEAAPEPEIVTKTVTDTKTVEVEVTPQSCLDALKHGDDLIALLGQGIDAGSDALTAVSNFDVPSIEAATKDMESLTPKVGRASLKWTSASDQCRNES